jgi:hypothetical protein
VSPSRVHCSSNSTGPPRATARPAPRAPILSAGSVKADRLDSEMLRLVADAGAVLAAIDAGVEVLPPALGDRAPPLSGLYDSPGRPRNHHRGRACSAADTSPVLPSSASRMSPRPGDFWRPTPLARKRPPKMVPFLPIITSQSRGVADRNANSGFAGASTFMPRHRGGQKGPIVLRSAARQRGGAFVTKAGI